MPDLTRYPERINCAAIGSPPRYRVRTTVGEWDKRPDALCDTNAYFYSPEADANGLEPWSMIDGTDARTDGASVDLWFASGRCMPMVALDFPVYVTEQTAAAWQVLAAPEAQRRGEEWRTYSCFTEAGALVGIALYRGDDALVDLQHPVKCKDAAETNAAIARLDAICKAMNAEALFNFWTDPLTTQSEQRA